MRLIAYDPAAVGHLSAATGATLVVGFATDEAVSTVAVSDSKDLAAAPRGNFLFIKAKQALPLQPVIVLTTGPHGLRRYVFDVVVEDQKDLGSDTPDLYYSVQFTYPLDEAARRAAAEHARLAQETRDEEARQATYQLNMAHQLMESHARAADDPGRNWHYVAQGDHSIAPLEIYDDGYSTTIRFPGNVRIPGVFVLDPDGKEATANFAVKGDLVVIPSVARGWRLRDGDTVLCIWNAAFDPVGRPPGTDTVSPSVQRLVKAAPR